jgi:antitoxin VapB
MMGCVSFLSVKRLSFARLRSLKIHRFLHPNWHGIAPFLSVQVVYTFDRDQLRVAMTKSAGANSKSTDAKLFWNGRSQAVRLPKEFRFEGDRVRVTRMGAGVLLEPIADKTEETIEEWFARLDAIGGDPIFPDGRKQNLAPIREYFK